MPETVLPGEAGEHRFWRYLSDDYGTEYSTVAVFVLIP